MILDGVPTHPSPQACHCNILHAACNVYCRLGQTKPVTVFRLVTKGTVDQNVLAIADRKLALDAAVLNDVTVGAGADGEGGDGEAGGSTTAGPKRGRPGLDSKEVRHMGAILSALLSGE